MNFRFLFIYLNYYTLRNMVSWSIFIIKVLLVSISIGLIASHFITVTPVDLFYQIVKNPEILEFVSGAIELGKSFV